MRKKLFFAACLAVSILAVTSCTDKFAIENTIVEDESEEVVTMTFEASLGDEDSKTVLTDNLEIYWTNHDSFGMFRKNNHDRHVAYGFGTVLFAPAKKASFTGPIDHLVGDDDCYFAVYPQSRKLYYRADAPGPFVEAELPACQYPSAGSFDPNAVIYAGMSSSISMRFFNVCSYIRFSLTNKEISKVTLRNIGIAARTPSLAGPMRFFYDEDGKPVGQEIVLESEYKDEKGDSYPSSTSIEVQSGDESTAGETFIPKKYYYVAVPSGQYDYLELIFETRFGQKATRRIPSFNLKRNCVASFTDADKTSKLTSQFDDMKMEKPVLVPELSRVYLTPGYPLVSLCWKGSRRINSKWTEDYYDDVKSYDCDINGTKFSIRMDNEGVPYGVIREKEGELYFLSAPVKVFSTKSTLNIKMDVVPEIGLEAVSESFTMPFSTDFTEFTASQVQGDIVMSWIANPMVNHYEIVYDYEIMPPIYVTPNSSSYELNLGDGKEHTLSLATVNMGSNKMPGVFSSCSLQTVSDIVRSHQLAPVIFEVDRYDTGGYIGDVYVRWDVNDALPISRYTVSMEKVGKNVLDAATLNEPVALVINSEYDYLYFLEDDDRQMLYGKNIPFQVKVEAESTTGKVGEGAAVINIAGPGDSYGSTNFNFPYRWHQ